MFHQKRLKISILLNVRFSARQVSLNESWHRDSHTYVLVKRGEALTGAWRKLSHNHKNCYSLQDCECLPWRWLVTIYDIHTISQLIVLYKTTAAYQILSSKYILLADVSNLKLRGDCNVYRQHLILDKILSEGG